MRCFPIGAPTAGGRDHSAPADRESGQATAEYAGVVVVVAITILVLVRAAPGLGGAISDALGRVVCAITGAGPCDAARPTSRHADAAGRAAALLEAERRSAPFVAQHGGRFAELADAARAAREAGDYERAEDVQAQLDSYAGLVGAGPRGALVTDLAGPSDREFDDLQVRGTIAGPGGKTNARYFEIAPSPGDGLVVMDFFIRTPTSGGFLRGDDRGFQDPLRSDLPVDRSRVLLLLDRESGRGSIVQTETCTRSAFGKSFCNEPRPIVLDMGTLLVNDRQNDATGEGVNLDVPNQFDIQADGDSITLGYDALNSITPLGISVDGTFTLERDEDGYYQLVEADRDDYPAIGIYQYRPSSPTTHVVDEDPGVGVAGAIPRCDLPDLPGPLPDLPTLPGPC